MQHHSIGSGLAPIPDISHTVRERVRENTLKNKPQDDCTYISTLAVSSLTKLVTLYGDVKEHNETKYVNPIVTCTV